MPSRAGHRHVPRSPSPPRGDTMLRPHRPPRPLPGARSPPVPPLSAPAAACAGAGMAGAPPPPGRRQGRRRPAAGRRLPRSSATSPNGASTTATTTSRTSRPPARPPSSPTSTTPSATSPAASAPSATPTPTTTRRTPRPSSVDGVADTWDQPLRGNFNQLRKLKKQAPEPQGALVLRRLDLVRRVRRGREEPGRVRRSPATTWSRTRAGRMSSTASTSTGSTRTPAG